MTIDEIKELIRVVHETGIAELEFQRGDNRVRIKSALAAQDSVHIASPLPAAVSSPSAAFTNASELAGHQLAASPGDERHDLVKSPIVGTYYDSPAPGSAPFVKVGDRVKVKQVLCIIESMKLMNEIEADIAGIILATHVENGRPVEYGELLFTIDPR